MRSPASRLYVKPLHCSTASGISAGTALFFLPPTLHLHNREIKFGPDPSCLESLRSHMHISQCSYATLQRAQGSWETPKVSCRLPLPHMNPLPTTTTTHPHHHLLLPCLSGSNSHGEPRVLETDTDRTRGWERGKKENMGSLGAQRFKCCLRGCTVISLKNGRGSVVCCWVTFSSCLEDYTGSFHLAEINWAIRSKHKREDGIFLNVFIYFFSSLEYENLISRLSSWTSKINETSWTEWVKATASTDG